MARSTRFSSKDNNHDEIAHALQDIGAAVMDTSSLGDGFPDIIVGFRGEVYLIEIKNDKTAYGKKGLNKKQVEFHAKWAGYVHIVRSIDEAYRLVGVL